MKALTTHLIAISALATIATTGSVTAETSPQAPTPETRIEESPSPAELTATRCLICHGNTVTGQPRLAPPFMMVKMHYQSLDEAAFIKTVSSWVKEPAKQKSKMPGAINRFGLMPALGFPEADVIAIAKYVYATDFPMPGTGGEMNCGPGATAAPNAGVGCQESCGPCVSVASKAEGPCATGKVAAPVPTAESADPATTTAPPAQKWAVPAAMMTHLQNLEKDIAAFGSIASADHANLAARIEKNLNQLISSCTMEGDSHNALHEWLVPFRELAKQHAESSDPAAQQVKVREMRRAFTTFHEQFGPAPQS